MSVRLEWDGKPERVERVCLPFQTVETINESRATRERDTGVLFGAENPRVNERSLLIWGDNKLVLSSLLEEYAGRIDLIYIDPPFDTGSDFTVPVQVGDQSIVKEPSILEEHAYRDTWGAGTTSFLTMLHDRLVLMRDLLSKLVRYGMTGGIAAIVDAGGFALLIRLGLAIVASAAASFCVAALVNYWLTSRFVFGQGKSARGFVFFFAVALIGLAVNVGVTSAGAYWIGLPPLVAKIAGIGTAFLVNFALNLGIVFRIRQ